MIFVLVFFVVFIVFIVLTLRCLLAIRREESMLYEVLKKMRDVILANMLKNYSPTLKPNHFVCLLNTKKEKNE